MLELLNSAHMTTSTTWKNIVDDVMNRNYDMKLFLLTNFFKKWAREAKFSDFIEVATVCTKMTCKDWKKKVKIGISPSKKTYVICLIESPFKMMKNAFNFILKALFVLKIFKVLPRLFGHVGGKAWLQN